jgi:hypothetical protein
MTVRQEEFCQPPVGAGITLDEYGTYGTDGTNVFCNLVTKQKNKQLIDRDCSYHRLAPPSTSVPSVAFVPYSLAIQKMAQDL